VGTGDRTINVQVFVLNVTFSKRGRACESETKTTGLGEADVMDYLLQEYIQCSRASHDLRPTLKRVWSWDS
jgi:hypothetical protein